MDEQMDRITLVDIFDRITSLRAMTTTKDEIQVSNVPTLDLPKRWLNRSNLSALDAQFM